MLYRGALETVQMARRAVAAGDIRRRSGSVSKAIEIMTELATSLNHEKGGTISRNLAELYDYMIRRLIEANTHQLGGPLAEVERLLSDLLEAWVVVASAEHSERQRAGAGAISLDLAALHSGLAADHHQTRESLSLTC
jgi:flagellar protein FliS